jgi:predicted ATPase
MSDPISRLTIEGFKSIRELKDFELRSLNVLIGANGAGKSNFVGFFRLLRELVKQRLQLALRTQEGGANACLYMGSKVTQRFAAKLYFGQYAYEFALMPEVGNGLVFSEESTRFLAHHAGLHRLGSGHTESKLRDFIERDRDGAPRGVNHRVYQAISSSVVYHFHDTSLWAGVRLQKAINDNEVLRPDAENLAAFLYRIRETNPDSYNQIRDVVQLAAPFFDDFSLRPVPTHPDLIQLEWLQKDSDYPFRAHQLSDGTLRFICLATALLQPNRPTTTLFDEPELGLHPYALVLLGDLFKQATEQDGTDAPRQVIVSTQSASLLNEFEPEDIVVVERHRGESIFRRLDSARLSEWLKEYTLGELWQKNVLGGRPGPENAPQLVPHGDGRP